MKTPANIQLIGDELALVWSDGTESYFKGSYLRSHSPSAETKGEKDILGQQHGGHPLRTFPNVRIVSWEQVGNYALRLDFSDGHRTGIYSFDYLQSLEGGQ